MSPKVEIKMDSFSFIHLFLRLAVLEVSHAKDQVKASAIGQWFMEFWCAHVQGWRVMVIEDDIILFRKTVEDHVEPEEDSTIKA